MTKRQLLCLFRLLAQKNFCFQIHTVCSLSPLQYIVHQAHAGFKFCLLKCAVVVALYDTVEIVPYNEFVVLRAIFSAVRVQAFLLWFLFSGLQHGLSSSFFGCFLIRCCIISLGRVLLYD